MEKIIILKQPISKTRERLLKGIGANFLATLLNFSNKILLTPLFLAAWGVDVYGEWLLLSSFVAYLSLTDMGGQLYIVNRLTQEYSNQNYDEFRKILHTGLKAFILLPLLVYFVFIIGVFLYSPRDFFQISTISEEFVFIVLAILGFQFVVTLPQGILFGVYRATGNLPKGVMLGNIILLIQLIFISFGLFFRLDMIWVACIQLVPFILVSSYVVYDLNSIFPELDICSLKWAELRVAKSFLRPSLHFFLIQLAQILSIQGTVLVVGVIFNPMQVVIFATTRTMVNVMKQLLSMITHSAWPEFTRIDMQGDRVKLYGFFRGILRSTMVASLLFFAIFYYFGDLIFELWLGDIVEYNYTIMNLFLVYLMQLIFWTTCSHLLMATNHHHSLSKILLISSVLGVFMAFILGEYLGLEGVLLGMIVTDLLIPFWFVPLLLYKRYRQFTLLFFLKELSPIIFMIICIVYFPVFLPIVTIFLFVWWLSCFRSFCF